MNISMPKIFFVGNLETTLCRIDKKMIERTDSPALVIAADLNNKTEECLIY